MGTVAQHRAGLKANLAAVFTSADVFDFESKKFPAGSVWVVSWPEDFAPHMTHGGDRNITYPVRFEIPWGDDESSDDAIEAAMQAAVAAIEADPTLGGSCDDLACLPFTNIGVSRRSDETVVLQFVVPVEVLD